MIYLDNAATTLKKPESVIRAVTEALTEGLGNSGRGAHDAALGASRLIYETRERTAALFGLSDPCCVAFTANATAALNLAIRGLFSPGDHVITTAVEHNSVLRPLYLMEEQGMKLTIVPADSRGVVNMDRMREEIEKAGREISRRAAVICTHASNLTGNLTDLGTIGSLCREHGLLFVADVSQTAGIFPIHMEHMDIDVLCFTGHKGLMGPQGTGGICVRPGLELRPLAVGGSGVHSYEKHHPSRMPASLEAGTLNGHGIAGLRGALAFLMETGLENVARHDCSLARRFYQAVRDLPGVRIYGDFTPGKDRAPVIALNIGDWDSGQTADELYTRFDIAVRAGAHCAPLAHRALGTEKQGAVRFSFSYFNTEEETDAAAAAVRTLSREWEEKT